MPGTLEKYSCRLPRNRKPLAIARKLPRDFPSDPVAGIGSAGCGLPLVSRLAVGWGCCPREGGIGEVQNGGSR